MKENINISLGNIFYSYFKFCWKTGPFPSWEGQGWVKNKPTGSSDHAGIPAATKNRIPVCNVYAKQDLTHCSHGFDTLLFINGITMV
jgi:hypothetical protein